MKKYPTVMIIRTTNRVEADALTLAECGFKVGDIVELDGCYRDGTASAKAIRNTIGIRVGDNVSLEACEYVVVEGSE